MSEIYELEEVLEILEEDEQPEEKTNAFIIDNDIKADWALKKIAEDRKECDRVKDIALKEIEVLKEKIEKLEKTTERKTSFLKCCLAQYFETVPHRHRKHINCLAVLLFLNFQNKIWLRMTLSY